MHISRSTQRLLDGLRAEITEGAKEAERKAMEMISKGIEEGKDDDVSMRRGQISRLKRAVRDFSEAEKRYLSEVEKARKMISTMNAD